MKIVSNTSNGFFSCISIASHEGVFMGLRISEEIRAPLKTPAWEASISMNSNERISELAS